MHYRGGPLVTDSGLPTRATHARDRKTGITSRSREGRLIKRRATSPPERPATRCSMPALRADLWPFVGHACGTTDLGGGT